MGVYENDMLRQRSLSWNKTYLEWCEIFRLPEASGKFGQCAKNCPTRTNACYYDEDTEFFRQF